MLLTYENVLPMDYFNNPTFRLPTRKMRSILKLDLDYKSSVYKLMQEFVTLMALCVREAAQTRQYQLMFEGKCNKMSSFDYSQLMYQDGWLLPEFNLLFKEHIDQNMLATGYLYSYQLDVKIDDAAIMKLEYLLRRQIVDYVYILRYYQSRPENELEDHKIFMNALEHAIGIASGMFNLTLAEHKLPPWYEDDTDDEDDKEDNAHDKIDEDDTESEYESDNELSDASTEF